MIQKFTDLRVWQLAHQLTIKMYKLTKDFPTKETFGLESQLRRSASSIGANISEGFSRDTKKDYVRFLYLSRGSLSETVNHLILARDLGYITDRQYIEFENEYTVLSKQLNSLISVIKKHS